MLPLHGVISSSTQCYSGSWEKVRKFVIVGTAAMVICRRETDGERITVEEDIAHGNGPQPPNYTRYPFTAGWIGVYTVRKDE